MNVQLIHPFLESAQVVIRQLIQVSPVPGNLEIKKVEFFDQHLWILIGMKGCLNGNVIYGVHEEAALRIVSAMLGGMEIQELDEIGKSAISELGNMISGNATAILSSQGMAVEITPPQLVEGEYRFQFQNQTALIVPLKLGDLGVFNIQVLIQPSA